MERFLGPLGALFANQFFFDQIYTVLVVRPLELLAMLAGVIDRFLVDGLVDFIASLPLGIGSVVRRLQSGVLQRYALAGVMGVLLIVFVLAWQLRG